MYIRDNKETETEFREMRESNDIAFCERPHPFMLVIFNQTSH